ncbi:MAG: hypothetical protein GF334_08195 [Candidatus Altiarchaeales archaeon]|nr:hypothetical protein [Candidatus Altiarchaeales archaeon]
MLYPNLLASTTAICHKGEITLPSEVGTFEGTFPCKRVILKGGHYFDAPLSAPLRIPHRVKVDRLRTGMTLHAPSSCPAPAVNPIPFDYTAVNNAGREVLFNGTFIPTEDEAELLGWLVGDGTIHSEKQSIRFTSTDVWVLRHVQDLVEKAFPSVKISWYAKNVGFDIIMAGGINNPLRHFLRRQRFLDGFPCAVSLYGEEARNAFLRGLWGADGWVSVRKGGSDVALGLSRSVVDGYTSMTRMFHALAGMSGQRRETPTKVFPNKHRLVFSGYRNYTVCRDMIGQIRHMTLKSPPVRRLRADPPAFTVQGISAHQARVIRILRLKTPLSCYEVDHG